MLKMNRNFFFFFIKKKKKKEKKENIGVKRIKKKVI
jgi:hypothetical protein